MQTYTHFLATAFLGERLGRRVRVRLAPFLLGSVLPDVPLILLTLWYFWSRNRLGAAAEHLFGPAYDELYFGDPVWIISTSLFHAPIVIAAMVAAGQWARARGRPWGGALFWFGLGCGFHTLLDIPTHRGDGPLLLFPFDWSYRLPAPLSYWDPAHGARIVAPLEHALDLAIVGYFAWLGVRRWRRRPPRRADGPPGG